MMNIYINRYKVYNICGTDIADMLLISKLNKAFCFLLSGIYMYIYIHIYVFAICSYIIHCRVLNHLKERAIYK